MFIICSLLVQSVLELRVYYLLVARPVSVGTLCFLFAAVVGYRVSFNVSDNSSYCPSAARGQDNATTLGGGGGACSVSDQTCSHCYWVNGGGGHAVYQIKHAFTVTGSKGGGGGNVMYQIKHAFTVTGWGWGGQTCIHC